MRAECPIRVGPRLASLAFAELRREMEISHCKWDAQIADVSTLAPFPLVIDGKRLAS